jgi:hypothetical protein
MQGFERDDAGPPQTCREPKPIFSAMDVQRRELAMSDRLAAEAISNVCSYLAGRYVARNLTRGVVPSESGSRLAIRRSTAFLLNGYTVAH